MHALGCLFFSFIIGFVLIISLVKGVISFLFGGSSRGGSHKTSSNRNSGEQIYTYIYIHDDYDDYSSKSTRSQYGTWTKNGKKRKSSSGTSTGKKKVIGDDEGEYVDYEEVK